MILHGLKSKNFDRLKPYTRKWIKELSSVLWALRMTQSRAMGHTLFSLVYGSEAMLPTEVEHKSFHAQQFSEEQSNDSRVNDLTKLEELREAVITQLAKHQLVMRQYHAHNINSHSFKVGDFDL
jgi:hypothetical protein